MSRNESPLVPGVEQAKDRLKSALEEACSAEVDHADTGELIRVEEALAIANDAAKEAISIRRRARTTHADNADDEPQRSSSRQITDSHGVVWTIFGVRPSAAQGHSPLRAAFQHGWLAFDSGRETRRLAPIPEGWEFKSDDELFALWKSAEAARRRPPSHMG